MERSPPYPPSLTLFAAVACLPKVHQALALASGVIVFRADTQALAVVADTLHVSFGTTSLWPERYRAALRSMSMRERLGITVYAVALLVGIAAIYAFITRVLLRNATRADPSLPPTRGGGNTSNQSLLTRWLLPSRRVSLLLGLLFVVTTVIDLPWIAERALDRADPRVHFEVQVALLGELLWHDLGPTALAVAIAGVISVSRHTTPRVALLRVLVARVGTLAALRDVFHAVPATIFPAVLLLATNHQGVHYAASDVLLNPSRSMRVKQVVAVGLFLLITRLAVVCVMVGVHVVELLALWLAFTLFSLWLPALLISGDMEASVLAATGAAGAAALCQQDLRTDVVGTMVAAGHAFVYSLAGIISLHAANVGLRRASGRRIAVWLTCATSVAVLVGAAEVVVHIAGLPSLAHGHGVQDVAGPQIRAAPRTAVVQILSWVWADRETIGVALVAVAAAVCGTHLTRADASQRVALVSRAVRAIVGSFLLVVCGLVPWVAMEQAPTTTLPHEVRAPLCAILSLGLLGVVMENRSVIVVHVERAVGLASPPPDSSGSQGSGL